MTKDTVVSVCFLHGSLIFGMQQKMKTLVLPKRTISHDKQWKHVDTLLQKKEEDNFFLNAPTNAAMQKIVA